MVECGRGAIMASLSLGNARTTRAADRRVPARDVNHQPPNDMIEHRASAPTPPEPDRTPPPAEAPEGDPQRAPREEPWHDPGPPSRKVNLPPGAPSPGIPVREPETPAIT